MNSQELLLFYRRFDIFGANERLPVAWAFKKEEQRHRDRNLNQPIGVPHYAGFGLNPNREK
jgi:hypothetical protein